MRVTSLAPQVYYTLSKLETTKNFKMGSMFFKRWDFLGNAILEAIEEAAYGMFKTTIEGPALSPLILNPRKAIERRMRTINKVRRRQYEELDSEDDSSDGEDEEQQQQQQQERDDVVMEDEPAASPSPKKLKPEAAASTPRPPAKKKAKKTAAASTAKTAAGAVQDASVITEATVGEMRKHREEVLPPKKRVQPQKVPKSTPAPAPLHPTTSAGVNMDSQDLFRQEDF